MCNSIPIFYNHHYKVQAFFIRDGIAVHRRTNNSTSAMCVCIKKINKKTLHLFPHLRHLAPATDEENNYDY